MSLLDNKLLDVVPSRFICPITKRIMENPVKLCDGNTYQRTAIIDWFGNEQVSPVTGEYLQPRKRSFVSDKKLKKQIGHFLEQNLHYCLKQKNQQKKQEPYYPPSTIQNSSPHDYNKLLEQQTKQTSKIQSNVAADYMLITGCFECIGSLFR